MLLHRFRHFGPDRRQDLPNKSDIQAVLILRDCQRLFMTLIRFFFLGESGLLGLVLDLADLNHGILIMRMAEFRGPKVLGRR